MSEEKLVISFIGLGAMGFGMATNLIKQGYSVTGFDVYAPTLERFTQAGGKSATTPAEATAGKQHCVCMVATAQQAQSVLLDGETPAIDGLPKGSIVYLCSTVPSSYVQGLEKDFARRGRPDILLIDCPVSGGAIRAGNGTLSIMAGGSNEAIKKGSTILNAMADPNKLYIVQGGVGAGSNMKMVHQVLAANQILSASEALGFASQLGLVLTEVAPQIVKSDGWSWMLENRLPRILAENHLPVASALGIIVKDTSIITSEARRFEFPTPLTSASEQVYFSGVRKGYLSDDDASLIRLYTEGKDSAIPVAGVATTKEDKLALVIGLLKGIHICSAVEALTYANHVGLDLDQVLDLCINAAGGSAVLSSVGEEVVSVLRGGQTCRNDVWADAAKQLDDAISEAQRLKVTTFLGSTAHNLIRLALRASGNKSWDLDSKALVSLWAW
ncbi:3-hydroxyisobutyrate dehydrogenase [Geosmithia morbida]|uniref:3-hydroxyisobutyrate dehydrogenase n=1 Tax=Geosmithia morbida TaxID=1094350 RepID=A0A9P4YNW3_9HYPO|nr:3-hydroxyisobutyrate dehydrogenase [Geosmithia morbida]KAF4120413.1 3-hydroxyisobutyrate dehydrogenase [Geosmithia morbida]